MLEGETLFDNVMVELLFNTSRGLFVCGLAADGQIDTHDEPVFLDNRPVTSANVVGGDTVLVTYKFDYKTTEVADVEVQESQGGGAGEPATVKVASTTVIARIDDVATGGE